MGEFDLIKDYFAPLAGPEGMGLKDDAACLRPEPGFDLVITKDAMVEGVHFPDGIYGEALARRLMRVNLSDLAAKGASPKGYLLSIAWSKSLTPEKLDRSARAFAAGLKKDQDAFGFKLFGGDTVATPGPMVVSATFIGQLPKGTMVSRAGARLGDDVWVTGTIGDSYLGLKSLQNVDFLSAEMAPYKAFLQDRFWMPDPRLGFTNSLHKFASSSADISDGLFADLGHVASSSDVNIAIHFNQIPFSQAGQLWTTAKTYEAKMALVTHGDDYELAFTADAADREKILKAAQLAGLSVSRIGTCHSGRGVTCLDKAGNPMLVAQTGYQHF